VFGGGGSDYAWAMKYDQVDKQFRAAVHYRSVECAQVRIAYREAGPSDAPVILLLHGFPTSSHMFRDLIPLLADRYHLIAPDYPGFGYSSTPPPDAFEYTFDHMTDVMEAFVDVLGVTRYALYMQDFGGPVGFRLASRRPQSVTALIIQNANAYDDGVSQVVRDVVIRYWTDPSPESATRLRELFELPVTMGQFVDDVTDPELVSPDSWQHAQWGMDRPGNKAIQFAIHANYGSNLERYPEWHDYFRRNQPPAIITWGRHDPIFTVGGALAYANDLAVAETHLLDAGHFALETHAFDIAMLVRDFLARYIGEVANAASTT
jgi:pimeloyl-ACP methyl ester carboxylesterase